MNTDQAPEPALTLRFQPGPVQITPGALALLHDDPATIARYLVRHLSGDGGSIGHWLTVELSEEEWQLEAFATSDDAKLNRIALTEGGRVLSSYPIGEAKLWIITDAVNSDEAYTTLLESSEY